MKSEGIELVRGSGNVFRDLGHASPDVEQLKAILAAEIIKMLDRKGLSVRGAHPARELPPPTFPAFAMPIWTALPSTAWFPSSNRLGSRVDVRVKVHAVLPVEQSRCRRLNSSPIPKDPAPHPYASFRRMCKRPRIPSNLPPEPPVSHETR